MAGADHGTSPVTPDPRKWTMIAAAIIAIGICGMAVGLAFAGWETGSILGLVTGLAATAGGLLPVAYKTLLQTNKQTDVLHEIAENTNGRLRALIRSEVAAAINGSKSSQVTPGVSQRDTAA